MSRVAAILALSPVAALLIWQAVAAHGSPDPSQSGLGPGAVVLSSSVLVLREGLEAVLVLAAVTAGMARANRAAYLRAVPVGAATGFAASVATWFAMASLISRIHVPALDLQAATGLVAIAVLLVVTNWFFHKVYWTGWIASHSNRRKRILSGETPRGWRVLLGLALLGFTAIYREGFEVVLFLQSLRLRAGSALVLQGASLGLAMTLVVALLTFAAHRHLPYKKMLIATGILLLVVLVVMVGEEAQEMQQAGWLPATRLSVPIPAWLGLWFSVFPTAETLGAQALAAILVAGSYGLANLRRLRHPDAGLHPRPAA